MSNVGNVINLGIATPAYNNTVLMSYANTLFGIQALTRNAGIGCRLLWSSSSSVVAVARNLLVDEFLRDDRLSHLLFIDADMSFPPEDLMRMLTAGESLGPHDIVAAISPRKRLNWERVMAATRMQAQLTAGDLAALAGSFEGMFKPVSGRMDEVFEDRPVEVEAIGTGIMLIGRAVLERLISHGARRVRMGSQQVELSVFFEDTVVDGFHISEDISFCHKVRQVGGRVWGVPWFRMTHGGNYDHIGDIGAISRAGMAL
ncbi:hypothetical protein J2W35_006491 [Variovorax boronicumulans]|uniref:hypothetical protein n=1 Tax=Variovorax boronicumulans TaxID=436515 RepID=UPI00277ECD7F|nr:hypothetical protein [Variovorax boronicumulans]MDQ0086110.1 hypothetical protein [Variovorax boronicumulans]